MIDADKLTTPDAGHGETKLMETMGAATALDLRRDGYGRAYGAQPDSAQVHLRDYWRKSSAVAAPIVSINLVSP